MTTAVDMLTTVVLFALLTALIGVTFNLGVVGLTALITLGWFITAMALAAGSVND